MNLITNTTQKTMLSTEIVKIINELREAGAAVLQHKHFMDKIRRVLGDSSAEFSSVYKDQQLIERPCYALPKREANLMVMSESYKVQAAVYDRMVLEQQYKLPKNYKEALLAIVVEVDKNEQLQQQVIALQPKAEAFERLSEAKGCELITNTAKILKLHPQMLFNKLQELGWIYRRGKNKQWVGYEDKIHLGLVEHVYTTTNNNWAYMQVLITPKGVTKLSNILNKVAA